jgi:hypothetical protein
MFVVLRIALLPELPLVAAPHKQLHGPPQRLDAARKAARFAGQAGEIMAEVGIAPFNRVGLAFIGRGGSDRLGQQACSTSSFLLLVPAAITPKFGASGVRWKVALL